MERAESLCFTWKKKQEWLIAMKEDTTDWFCERVLLVMPCQYSIRLSRRLFALQYFTKKGIGFLNYDRPERCVQFTKACGTQSVRYKPLYCTVGNPRYSIHGTVQTLYYSVQRGSCHSRLIGELLDRLTGRLGWRGVLFLCHICYLIDRSARAFCDLDREIEAAVHRANWAIWVGMQVHDVMAVTIMVFW